MNNSPKYLTDTPHGKDFFNTHTHIATTLVEIIKSEDVSKNSFTLGLLGSWGSGKSLTIKLLREKLVNDRNILFIEFDVWKYIDTSLYRSILIDLENDLRQKASEGLVGENYKTGIKTNEGKDLYEILYKSSQTSIPQVVVNTDKLSKKIHEWETKSRGWRIMSFFTLRFCRTVKIVFEYFSTRGELFYFLAGMAVLFSFAYYYRSNIVSLLPFLSDKYLKPIFQFLIYSGIGLSAIELFKESFKDLFGELLPKNKNNVILTSPPTFAQDQFESIFRSVIKDICLADNKKIVLVFDNIDRCENELALQVLSGLKTFLDEPKCFYIIPCDDTRIKDHFQETSRSQDDFLDKIFQAYVRIPTLMEENKIGFIGKCLEETAFTFESDDKKKIIQILTLAYFGNTPRQIKRFFNDFVSYYKLAKTIDPEEKFLLKDVGHFAFMVTIKQKWPKVEEILQRNPSAFIKYHKRESVPELQIPQFTQYLDSCISWIDLDSNVADFIYLTDAKQTGSNIQKIVIEGFDNFILTQSLIGEFDAFLTRATNEGNYIFLERGLDRLMPLIKKHLDTDDKSSGIELLKVYTKHLILYDGAGFTNKKESYLLSHFTFFVNYCNYISQIDRNRISDFEVHASKILRATGYNDVTAALYSVFTKEFKEQNIAKVFENPIPEDLPKLNGFIEKTDSNIILNVVPLKYFELLANTITFSKTETGIINIFKPLLNITELTQIRQNLAVRLDQLMASFYNTQGPHVLDAFVLEGLTILTKSDFTPTNNNSLGSYIQTRITHLFQHVGPDQAVEYFIQFIRLSFSNPHSVIQNGYLNVAPNFNKFLEKIPTLVLETSLDDPSLKEQLFSISKTTNTLPVFYSRISDDFYKTKINTLFYNHLNSLTGILDELIKRKSSINDSDLTKSESEILDTYSKGNFELFAGNFEQVIPKISFSENKDVIIEKLFAYFNPNPAQNYASILKALGFIEDGMARNYTSSIIDTITSYLEDSFDLNKQISTINVLNKIEKKNYTKDQSQKINSLLSEIHFEDLDSEKALEDLKRKLDYNVRTADKIDFKLNTQTIGGDHAHSMLLNLKKFRYEIVVTPQEGINFWRYGIKLSSTRNIDTTRLQPGVKLFHLTKNADSDSLYVTFYDQNSTMVYPQPGDKLIKMNYTSEPITFELNQTENGIHISIRDKNNEPLLTEPLGDNTLSYCRLLAWADNATFDLNSKLKRIPIAKG